MIKKSSNNNPLFWFGAGAVTIYPNIYIKEDMYRLGSVRFDAMIKHEEVHLEQQEKMGKVWFLKYAADKKFRFKQELEAYKAEYLFLKSKSYPVEKEGIARSLSSKTYFNMCTYSEALDAMKSWN